MPKSSVIAAAVLLFGASAAAGLLHDAVKSNDLAKLQELIEAGEDLTAQDKFIGTALHFAGLRGNVEAARLLVDAGADVNLPKWDSQQTALHMAAWRGRVDAVEFLIEVGADVEARADQGDTPLQGCGSWTMFEPLWASLISVRRRFGLRSLANPGPPGPRPSLDRPNSDLVR